MLVTSVAYLEKFDKPSIHKYVTHYTHALKTDPQDRDALLAIGICYLKLALFDLADKFLRQLLHAHPADPSGYYFHGICLLKGKRPRVASLVVIREAERLIGAAMELDPTNGRYDVILAAIRHDYYVLNGMRVPDRTPEDLLASAEAKHVDRLEVEQSLALIKITSGPVSRYVVT